MSDLTPTEVGDAMANLGNYRVKRAQAVAAKGAPDGISGALLLALGLRETRLRNIEGGAMLLDGKWVPQTDPQLMDVGWTQINRHFHSVALAAMPGVKAGTWAPVIEGQSAMVHGYVPRFEEALQFTLRELHEAMAFAADNHLPADERVQFAVAAHNAGPTGALAGVHAGDVDRYTAGGDYSAWVLRHRSKINTWLRAHVGWQA